ncbi:9121_t:CDS:2, partial [Funneliformis geosporum]
TDIDNEEIGLWIKEQDYNTRQHVRHIRATRTIGFGYYVLILKD